jgi:prepilin-type N-terminal cleavage/methylation domain-containing protein
LLWIIYKERIQIVKKAKGFTLVELLIVVAIVGILSVLVIPNAVVAIQKAKQKESMKQIVHLATACADYVTTVGYAPDSGNQSGPLQPGNNFIASISPMLLRVCPINDQWGTPFRVYTGTAVASVYNIPAEDIANDDFLIVSFGRDGTNGGDENFTYNTENPAAGLYRIESIADFNNDLVNLNGSWLHAPRILFRGS